MVYEDFSDYHWGDEGRMPPSGLSALPRRAIRSAWSAAGHAASAVSHAVAVPAHAIHHGWESLVHLEEALVASVRSHLPHHHRNEKR